MKKIDFKKWKILPGILLLGGNLLSFMTLWLLSKYDHVYFDQVLYQLKTPADGANNDLLNSVFVRVGLFGILLTALEILLYFLFSGKLQKIFPKWKRYQSWCARKKTNAPRRFDLLFSIFSLLVAIVFFFSGLNILSFLNYSATDSDFIVENYVNPNAAKLTFPKEKRNLIYIFLESMENTFSDPKAGGLIYENYIPELTALAEDNINFSHNDGIGGAYSYAGTTWTAAAMVAQTSGLIIKTPLLADNYGGEDAFLPGIVSLGELLKQQGYQQTLLVGSDAAFAGRETYFTEHGNYKILDINALKAEQRLPKDYREWWGFEDQKLFQFAKEELEELAASDRPFNLTLLTADTHFPDGYLCPACEDQHEEQYANVLSCSARQVQGFLDWLKKQPYYENTTVILAGDHLTMDPHFMEDIEEDYLRTTYNCIINSPIQPQKEKNRKFSTFDMFPTTLAAMGVTINGERLGLGTNLFSSRSTLTEEYGFEMLDEELQKRSVFYNTQILGMKNGRDKGSRTNGS